MTVTFALPRGLRSFRHSPFAQLIALAFVITLGEAVLTPLLPTIADRFALSSLAIAAIVSATTLAMLVVSLGAGSLLAHLPPARLLLLAAVIVPPAALAEALAPNLAVLIGARLLFGLAYAVVWTLAPMAATARPQRTAAMAATIGAAGGAWLVGPPLSGVLAAVGGIWLPFSVVAVLGLPLVALIATSNRPLPIGSAADLTPALDLARRRPAVRGAILAMALLGIVGGLTNLLAPVDLASRGLSAAAIGLVFSAASVAWIAGARLAGKVKDVRVDRRLVAAGAAGIAVIWATPAISGSTVAIGLFLVLSASCRAALNTVVFVLARSGDADGAGSGGVVRLMNLAWAVTALSAPLLAGALDAVRNPGGAFAAVAAAGLILASAIAARPVRLPRLAAAGS